MIFAALSAASLWVAVAGSGGGFDPDNRDPAGHPGDMARQLARDFGAWLSRRWALAVGAVAGLTLWIGLFYALPRLLPGTARRTTWTDFILYAGFLAPTAVVVLRSFRSNRPFIFAAVIFLFTWTTVAVIQSVLPFFLTFWLHWEGPMVVPLGAMFVSALAFLPFWNWFTVRAGKRVAYVAGMASLVAILVLLSALPSDVDRTLVIVIAALAGFGVSAAHVVPNSILPDGIEWEELRTGTRKEGFFFGVVSLLNKVGTSVAVPWVALVLAATGYEEARGLEQPAGTVLAIRLLVGLAPAVLLAFGVVAAAIYPLNRDRHERIIRLVALRKAWTARTGTAGSKGGAGPGGG
jgi:Na+/melibiose symporter-like transporter